MTYDFKPNQLDHRFKNWIVKGITFHSITDKGQLKDFQALKDKCVLEKQDFYRYPLTAERSFRRFFVKS